MHLNASVVAAFFLAACGKIAVSPTRVDGPAGSLAINDGGSGGLPVVFVHSLAGSSSHWQSQLEHLRRSRRAIALDFRGHGDSEAAGNRDYSLEGMAGDIAAVVDALKVERFVLVGHSMGGGVALTYAGDHPEKVAGLLLVDPIGDGKQIPPAESKSFLDGLESNYEETIRSYWMGIAGPDSAVQARLIRDLQSTPREAVVQALRSVMQFEPQPALAHYRGPILSVVTPNNNQPFSLHQLGSGFPYRIVEGTGHWIQLDRPEVFNRLLDDFLEGVNTAHAS